MTALLAETVLMWRAHWPPPLCRDNVEHGFTSFPFGFVCDFCGAQVAPEDAIALEAWWTNYHRWTLVYERN